MLEPMLFDRSVIDQWGSGKRAHGFRILANTLLHTCILDIAKIALDKDKRTPSVAQLVAALEDPAMVAELREEFAIWNLAPISGEDPDVIALLQAAERREEDQRRTQFDELVTSLRLGWEELIASPALASFSTMRDKLIAHSELWHDGASYRPFDVALLGLKFGDLRVVITRLRSLVDLITLVYRNSSFDFEMLDKQLARAQDQFWSPAVR